MILFGWGRRSTRDLGSVGPYACRVCGANGYFRLIRVITWFTLFFIPVIPYSTKHFIVCPNCKDATEIAHGRVKEFREFAEQNR